MPATSPVTSRAPKTRVHGNGVESTDYKYILDSQGVDTDGMPDTKYMKDNSISPTIREATVKGKDQKYYTSEQGKQNIALKSLVEESEDFMATLYELHYEQIGDAKNVLEYRYREEFDRLREFGNGFKWASGMGFTSIGIIKQLSLIIQQDIFNRRRMGCAVQSTPFTIFLKEALQEAKVKAKPKKLSEVAIGTGSNRQSLGDGGAADETALEAEEEADLNGQNEDDDDDVAAAPPRPKRETGAEAMAFKCLNHYLLPEEFKAITEFVEAHLEMIGTDVFGFIKEELRRSRMRLQELENELYDCKQEQRIAFQANNMGEADLALNKCVEVLEAMIKTVRYRLSQTTDGCADAGTFQGNYMVHAEKFSVFLETTKNAAGQLHGELGNDIDTLNKKVEHETEKHKQAVQEFTDLQQASYKQIQDHNNEQSRIWEEIRRLATEVQKIGAKKATAIQSYVKRKEEEERRTREYNEFVDTLQKHAFHLKKLQENVETQQKVLDETEVFYDAGCDIIDGKNVQGELDGLRERELKLYLDVYRQYVLMIGDLILRRRTRLQGVRRLIRNQEAQLEMCQDSLDPFQEKYKEDLDVQRTTEKEVVESLEDLLSRMKLQEEEFEPIERALEELDDFEFTPPKFELNEVEQDRRDKLLGYQRQILNREQDEVSKETLDLRRLHANVKQGRDIITQRKQKRAAKSNVDPLNGAQSADFGPDCASSPLSNDGMGARADSAPAPPIDGACDAPSPNAEAAEAEAEGGGEGGPPAPAPPPAAADDGGADAPPAPAGAAEEAHHDPADQDPEPAAAAAAAADPEGTGA
eukprot:TRINITY_DN439_c3_g2_i1.p1 TRINITY_DN439_c3_g2~~TRINITY_DN439_c3_g2_i1.p1  ORF type:complete len:812 (+),score=369.58 TRINITY_DN439_c3_g2_i1:79-2514(+)